MQRFGSAGYGRLTPVAFVLLLLLGRIGLLLASCDPEEDRVLSAFDAGGLTWERGPERPLYDREELYTGAAAELMRLHPPLPDQAYRFMPYGGGSLWVARAAAALFGLFGPTYLTFKFIALLVTLVGGLAWWATVRRWLGESAARWFALLYLFAPTVLVRTALIAKGDHAEAMAWLGVTAWFATEACFRESLPIRRLCAALAGLWAGLGVELTYSTVPVTAAFGVIALFRTRVRPRPLWGAAGLGLLLGLIPWMASMQQMGFGVTRVYDRPLGSFVAWSEAMHRLALLFRTGLAASYDLPGGLRAFAGVVWLATFLAAVALIWVRRLAPASVRWLLGGALVAHGLAFVLTAPDASSRYLVPAYPLLLVAVTAAFAPRAAETMEAPVARWRRAALAFGPVLLFGLLAQLMPLVTSDFPARRAPLRGYDWPLLGEVLGTKLHAEGVQAMPAPVRPYLWVGLGRKLSRLDPPKWAEALAVAGPEASFAWEGIGVGLAETGRANLAPAALRVLPERERAGLRRGLWRYGECVWVPLLREGRGEDAWELIQSLDAADQPAARRSLARAAAVLDVHAAEVPSTTLSAVFSRLDPDEEAEAMGWALCRRADSRGVRWWRPPPGARSARWYEAARRARLDEGVGPEAASAFRSGAAAAWTWGLGTRVPRAVLGGSDGPVALAREAAALASSFGPAVYQAAGEAAAAGREDPSWLRTNSVEAWRWEEAIPEAGREAFRAGLESSGRP